MSGNVNKYKKYFIIIVPILLIAVIVELILLLKPNNELKSNQVKPNYDDDIKLGDSTILFDSANVNYDNTNSGLTSTKVQDAIDELYTAANTCTTNLGTCQSDLATCQSQIPPTCSNSPFHVGDYIDMTPTSTSYAPDRNLRSDDGSATAATLNPSELNVWRVIRINGDCTVEMVSEYVSSQELDFWGKKGYQNLIYVLNEIAKQYANTTYTLNPSTAPDGAFRNVGYDGQTKQITNTTRIDDTTLGASGGAWYQKTTSMNGEESLGGGDQGYLTDLKLMEDAGISLVAYKYNTAFTYSYWLASRLYDWTSDYRWVFNARFVSINGSISSNELWAKSKSSFGVSNGYNHVRPIITLKSNITHSSGSGTSASHYTLSAS